MDSDLYELIGVERTASTQEVYIFLPMLLTYTSLNILKYDTRQCNRKFIEFEFYRIL